MKVLVAEDDPVSREIMTTLLDRWGYKVTVAPDGVQAMTALRGADAPSLAILDWMMPGMDGVEICRRVREVNRSLYIILVTSRGGKADVIEGLTAGADDYLIKPFDREELHVRIQVGIRAMKFQAALNARLTELEKALEGVKSLNTLQIPL